MEKDCHLPENSFYNQQLHDSSTNNIFDFGWGDEISDLPSSYFDAWDDKFS